MGLDVIAESEPWQENDEESPYKTMIHKETTVQYIIKTCLRYFIYLYFFITVNSMQAKQSLQGLKTLSSKPLGFLGYLIVSIGINRLINERTKPSRFPNFS